MPDIADSETPLADVALVLMGQVLELRARHRALQAEKVHQVGGQQDEPARVHGRNHAADERQAHAPAPSTASRSASSHRSSSAAPPLPPAG